MDSSETLCFVAVEFPNDPNVAGLTYWYLCPFAGAEEGDGVVAPLGRHNNCQIGVIRVVSYRPEYEAPFPIHLIKSIKRLVKPNKE